MGLAYTSYDATSHRTAPHHTTPHAYVSQVDKVAAAIKRYAGDYKTMTKRLEAKYNDYGFFIGWENDSGFAAIQKEGMAVLQEKGAAYYQQYVPFQIRNGFKNIYLNANFYGKKAYKMVSWQSATVVTAVHLTNGHPSSRPAAPSPHQPDIRPTIEPPTHLTTHPRNYSRHLTFHH